jgi:hypothetical protein
MTPEAMQQAIVEMLAEIKELRRQNVDLLLRQNQLRERVLLLERHSLAGIKARLEDML